MNESPQTGSLRANGASVDGTCATGEFWSLVLAAFLFNFDVSVFFFLYNLLMLNLGFREQSLGVLASTVAPGSMAGSLPMNIAAQWFGLKRVVT